ncbi:MAG: hypothetical protein R3F59_27570 [Myxococcota bacterium]
MNVDLMEIEFSTYDDRLYHPPLLADDFDHDLTVTARGTVASLLSWNVHEAHRFDDHRTFSFQGLGAEAALHLGEGVEAVAGIGVLQAVVAVPPDRQGDLGVDHAVAVSYPVNLGFLVKPMREWQPYFGADALFARYPVDAGRSGTALGGRLRVGSDYMLGPHIGLNLDAALGGWGGAPREWVEREMRNGGILPQLSAGVVLAD